VGRRVKIPPSHHCGNQISRLVTQKYTNYVSALLDNYADPEKEDSLTFTALREAVAQGHYSTVKNSSGTRRESQSRGWGWPHDTPEITQLIPTIRTSLSCCVRAELSRLAIDACLLRTSVGGVSSPFEYCSPASVFEVVGKYPICLAIGVARRKICGDINLRVVSDSNCGT